MSVNVSALKIHMSEDAHNAITAFPEFFTECRGDIAVKVEKQLLYNGSSTYYITLGRGGRIENLLYALYEGGSIA